MACPTRSFFVVEFPICPDFRDDEKNGGAIGRVVKLTDRQKEIIELIKADNKISYRAIAQKFHINDSAVDKHIKILKEKGVLERFGGTRGHWEVKHYEC